MITHKKFSLAARPRGFHLITAEILSHLDQLPDSGYLKLFLQHTSAGLTISENADPDVRADFESIFNKLIPENLPFLKHTIEGPDDMPAHIKSSLVGVQLEIPIYNGALALGTWQGVYLCEFRNRASQRKMIASILT